MTAANPDANDNNEDDRYQRHLSIDNDDSTKTTSAFPHWDKCYSDSLFLTHTYDASIPSTKEGKQEFMPAVSPADDNPTTTAAKKKKTEQSTC